jgi:hypothetical protein
MLLVGKSKRRTLGPRGREGGKVRGEVSKTPPTPPGPRGGGGGKGQRGGETGRRLFMSSRRETCRSSRYFPPCPGPAYDSRYAPTWYVSDTRDWVPGWPRPAATATRGVAAAKAKPNGNNASVVPPRHTGRTLSPVPSLSSACAT